jgi:phosphoglycolate phosphatase-like HAD superfamily hydrolase
VGNSNAFREIFNLGVKRAGYDCFLTPELFEEINGLKFSDIVAVVVQDPHARKKVLDEFRKIYSDDLNIVKDSIFRHVSATPHLHYVLQEVSDQGHDQIIISNAGASVMPYFIQAVGIEELIPTDKIFPVGGFPHGKDVVLDEYVQGKNFDHALIIGDSSTDIALKDVALSKDINATALQYSHQGLDFKPCNGVQPDKRIRDLKIILDYI